MQPLVSTYAILKAEMSNHLQNNAHHKHLEKKFVDFKRRKFKDTQEKVYLTYHIANNY